MIPIIYIYCYWLWIFTLFFLFNLTPYSPLLGLIMALIFTTLNNIFIVKSKISFKFFIIFFELLLVLLVLNKNTKLNIKFNIFLFLVYYLILTINNKTFYQIYFVDLPKHINPQMEASDYINKRMKSSFKNIKKFLSKLYPV